MKVLLSNRFFRISCICFFVFLGVSSSIWAKNPFLIGIGDKTKISNKDYTQIQVKLRALNIENPLRKRYPNPSKGHLPYSHFYRRCTIGKNLVLIDPNRDLFPTRVLKKIGEGGEDNCIVCFASLNGRYPNYLNTLERGLREQGYKGYFLCYQGAWPNPTGKEIKFIGIPYSFKVFAMVEAHSLGFRNVLWLDSACYPVRDINPLFEIISKQGGLLYAKPLPKDHWKGLLPKTRTELLKLTGTDVLGKNIYYIFAGVFGMRMDTPDAQDFIKGYYQMVELGTPFLSCWPEEWVMTALIGRLTSHKIQEKTVKKLISTSPLGKGDSPQEYENVKRQGFYFYLHKAR